MDIWWWWSWWWRWWWWRGWLRRQIKARLMGARSVRVTKTKQVRQLFSSSPPLPAPTCTKWYMLNLVWCSCFQSLIGRELNTTLQKGRGQAVPPHRILLIFGEMVSIMEKNPKSCIWPIPSRVQLFFEICYLLIVHNWTFIMNSTKSSLGTNCKQM